MPSLRNDSNFSPDLVKLDCNARFCATYRMYGLFYLCLSIILCVSHRNGYKLYISPDVLSVLRKKQEQSFAIPNVPQMHAHVYWSNQYLAHFQRRWVTGITNNNKNCQMTTDFHLCANLFNDLTVAQQKVWVDSISDKRTLSPNADTSWLWTLWRQHALSVVKVGGGIYFQIF